MNVTYKIIFTSLYFTTLIPFIFGQKLESIPKDTLNIQDSLSLKLTPLDSLSNIRIEDSKSLKEEQLGISDSLSHTPNNVIYNAIIKKRIYYGIAAAVPICLFLLKDKDSSAPLDEVGPPPGWPDS